jgi:hypothetical protein
MPHNWPIVIGLHVVWLIVIGLHVVWPIVIGQNVVWPIDIGLHVVWPIVIGQNVVWPIVIGLHVVWPIVIAKWKHSFNSLFYLSTVRAIKVILTRKRKKNQLMPFLCFPANKQSILSISDICTTNKRIYVCVWCIIQCIYACVYEWMNVYVHVQICYDMTMYSQCMYMYVHCDLITSIHICDL